jgi:hypothetical protein
MSGYNLKGSEAIEKTRKCAGALARKKTWMQGLFLSKPAFYKEDTLEVREYRTSKDQVRGRRKAMAEAAR